jgi:uncharacterized phage protein gp47/JayE
MYIVFPLTIEPDDLYDAWAAEMQAAMPGWQEDAASPECLTARTMAQTFGDALENATGPSEEIFRFYGRSVRGIAPLDEQPAAGTVQLTVTPSAAGVLVDAGLQVSGGNQDGVQVTFATVADLTVPANGTTGTVAVVAVDAGEVGNGVTGPGQVQDPVPVVTAVTFVDVTADGRDREEDSAYLDRLSDVLRLAAPRAILPRDFAQFARELVPGVARCAAINLLDASANGGAGATNQEGHLTLVPVDDAGQPVPSAAKQQVVDLFTADKRVLNGVVHVIDPTYTTIGAALQVTAEIGFALADVQAAAIAAAQGYLNPATYGLPRSGEDLEWHNRPVVTAYDVGRAVGLVESVQSVLAVSLSGGTGATDQARTLGGLAPLPVAGAITCTVTAGS